MESNEVGQLQNTFILFTLCIANLIINFISTNTNTNLLIVDFNVNMLLHVSA